MLFFLFAYFRSKRQLFPDPLMGIATFIFIFTMGIFSAFYSIPTNQSEHYLQKASESQKELFAKATVTEELKPTAYSSRYILKVDELITENKTQAVRGKILLNIRIDSSGLQPGNEIFLPWTPEEIAVPLNPFQFNYRKYMQNLGVERQLNLQSEQINVLHRSNSNLLNLAWGFREDLITELKKYDLEKEELAVFQALILGQRREIDDKLYKDYAAAGAIHILAISGLHIGILLLLLNSLLKPVERLKYGKYLKAFLVIVLLWSFALLTGLSPSVVRAVTMFTFIAIGLQLKRKTSPLNSLFLSLFFLLLINPFYLFQVGFQLSYLAVFSIIVFQPFIYRLFTTKIKIIDYFWKMVSVSLAAQIGILALSLFYFHQFPGLFLLSNLVVLPVLGFVLAFGILIILLALANILPEVLVEVLGSILKLLNSFIRQIAGIETMVLSDIDFSIFQCIAAYLILVGILLILSKPNFRRLCFLLISILIFQLASFYNKTSIPSYELVVFHKSRETIIGKKHKKELTLFTKTETEPGFLKSYIRERRIENVKQKEIPYIFQIKDQLCLVVDTTSNYNVISFQPEIIFLRNSPKLNIERLIDNLQPKRIIADGSNYPSFVNRWEKTCRTKKIPFLYTGEKGAFIFNQ
ncbi:ComEC family competence protein [Gramella jeungdoensis]|uniref:ComEC family competence protein n=1 Tax=Gramella jeungdoensis TaxID=708091 RepID=A0ABT0Z676_9FLAO|nr:ComEC/Rec2 family competence protein [Gramella jeungdoensis]MCM8571044.1 ComEC family competence protein [Gramella jeungdoensis]